MRRFIALFGDSYREFGKPANICVMGVFAAVSVVIGYFTLVMGPGLKIGFSTIPNQCVYYLFGPAAGALFGGASDLLKFMVRPTGPFFIGYTFNAMLAGLLYGCFYYKRPLGIGRILVAEFVVAMICNVWLNTQWIALTGVIPGKGFWALVPGRLAKNLVMWPFNALLFYTVASTLERHGMWRALGRRPGGCLNQRSING